MKKRVKIIIISILAFLLLTAVILVLLRFHLNNKEVKKETLSNQKITVIYNSERYALEGLPSGVDLTLIGKREDLELVKNEGEPKIILDLTNFEESLDYQVVKLEYDVPLSDIRYELNPSSVKVKLVPKIAISKTLTTKIVNEDRLNSNLTIERVDLNLSEVVLKGGSSTLTKVSDAVALIDLEKIGELKAGTNYISDIPLAIYNESGEEVNVEIVPKTVSATILVSSSSEIVTKEIDSVPIQVRNLDSSYNAISLDGVLTTAVTVRGEEEIISSLNADDITAYIDLRGYSIGVHEVQVMVLAEEDSVTYLPRKLKIQVKITEK